MIKRNQELRDTCKKMNIDISKFEGAPYPEDACCEYILITIAAYFVVTLKSA